MEKRILKRLGQLAVLGGALAASSDAEADIRQIRPGEDPEKLANVVAPQDAETIREMNEWGIHIEGNRRIVLDIGRTTLVEGEDNLLLEVEKRGEGVVRVKWTEIDGGQGYWDIRQGRLAGKYEFDPLGNTSPEPRAERGGGQHRYGEYGSTRVYAGIHDKPRQPTPPGMEWFWHDGKNGERDWWYVGPSNDRGR